MLEVAFLASHILWMTSSEDLEKLYNMVTIDAARSINVKDFGLEVGATANLVIMKEPNVLEALRYHEEPEVVISHGKIVDREQFRS